MLFVLTTLYFELVLSFEKQCFGFSVYLLIFCLLSFFFLQAQVFCIEVFQQGVF